MGSFLLACVICQSTFIEHQQVMANFKAGMMPGMILRIDHNSINNMKHGLKDFLPHFVDEDASLPKEFKFEVETLFSFYTYVIQWHNLTYS